MYGVEFVAESRLPRGHDWLLARDRATGRTRLYVNEEAVTPEVLEQAWAGYRLLVRARAAEMAAGAGLPRQRQGSPSPLAAL